MAARVATEACGGDNVSHRTQISHSGFLAGDTFMTLARTRARNISMGIGANGAARIEREHSCSTVERLVGELRQEVAFRDKRRKELEFLEKGGNALDFEYGDVVALPSSLSTVSVVLSDSEAKERKLFVLPNNILPKHGILTEVLVSRLQRNGDFNDPIKQVLRRGIVRVKEEKSGSPLTVPADTNAPNGPCTSAQSKVSEPAVPEDSQPSPPQEANRENKTVVKEEVSDNGVGTDLTVAAKRSEEEILDAATSIKAVVESAAKKPLPGPLRGKSHWDFVLEEMAWLANDFMQERLWKTSAAAHFCRSASQAPFWTSAEAASESRPSNGSGRLPLDRYATKFRESMLESPPCLKAPPTPDVKERTSDLDLERRLHYIVPPGATEAYKALVEDSWASAHDCSRQSSQDSDSELEDDLSRFENDVIFANGLKKKRKQPYDFNSAKKLRTGGVPSRQRSDKKQKKAKANKATKGTDSENEWVPEAVQPEKQPKRKRDQLFVHRATDLQGQGSKRPKLSKLISKKSILRKGDFYQAGNGGTWSPLEDQAILVLEHDFGGNWKLLSDILNAGSHIRGRFRSPKACQDRHAFLGEASGDPSLLGLLKGSAMLLLQKLQGPLEHDTLKLHFEEIVKAKQRSSPAPRDQHTEVAQPHESHAAVVAQAQSSRGRFLSPLDFPDDQTGDFRQGGGGTKRETFQHENTVSKDSKDGSSAQASTKPDISRTGQSGRKAGNQKPQQQQQMQRINLVKQEPLQRASSDPIKLDQQQQVLQSQQTSQRNLAPQKTERLESRLEQQQQQAVPRMNPRPSLQQQKLPSCSAPQQLQSHKSLPEQHQHLYRPPPQAIQQATYYNNNRFFNAAGPGTQARVAQPGAQWRPSQPSPQTYNSHNPRLPKQASQSQQVAQPLQQQPQYGAAYVPSPAGVRFQGSPGSLHPAFPGKTWNGSERTGMGGSVATSPAAVVTTATAAAAANDPSSASCK